MSEHSNVVAADLPEPYSAEVGLQRHIEQAHAISSLLSEAGVGPCSLPEGVRLLMNDRDRLADTIAAERIENAHLREAFVTMEKAYNANEAALAVLREQTCETCDNEKFMSGEGATRWCALMRVRSCIPRYCGAWQKRREP